MSRFAMLPEVRAIVLAGSRATGQAGETYGEKRLVDFAEQLCPLRPPTLRDDITAFLRAVATDPTGVVPAADRVVDSLAALLDVDCSVPAAQVVSALH